MKRKYSLLLISCLMTVYSASAQVGDFSYQVSFPTGDFGDFIEKTSFVGFSAGGRKYLKNDQWSIGGSFSWFYFPDKRGMTTVDLKEQGTYTGFVTNYTNIYALMAVAQYDLKERKERIVPFLRAGIGGAYQNQREDIGLYAFKNDGIQFALNGEAGITLSKDGMRGIFLAATYHYFPEASDMVSTSFFGIKLGVSNSKYR